MFIHNWQIRVVHHVLLEAKWAPILKFRFSLVPCSWTACFIIAAWLSACLWPEPHSLYLPVCFGSCSPILFFFHHCPWPHMTQMHDFFICYDKQIIHLGYFHLLVTFTFKLRLCVSDWWMDICQLPRFPECKVLIYPLSTARMGIHLNSTSSKNNCPFDHP